MRNKIFKPACDLQLMKSLFEAEVDVVERMSAILRVRKYKYEWYGQDVESWTYSGKTRGQQNCTIGDLATIFILSPNKHGDSAYCFPNFGTLSLPS
jgi:hypothetical protein